MKVKPEHIEIMRNQINAFADEFQTAGSSGMDFLVKEYEEGRFPRSELVKDLNVRFCWDMAQKANLEPFICDTLYSYGCHDSHVESALRFILPKLTRRY